MVGERIASLLDELGIDRAHLAYGSLSEDAVHQLLRARPSSVASVTALLPNQADAVVTEEFPGPVSALFAANTVGGPAEARAAFHRRPGASLQDLPADYPAEPWSDLIADRTADVLEAIRAATAAEQLPAPVPRATGEVAGVRYEMSGNGPPLVAVPIAIAPSQWDAALEELQRQFTVIRLGGPHIGFVAVLETRAANPGYHWGVRGVLARLEIKPGERILEVGTGSGALVRDLARRTGGANPIVGVDINAYLLDEASVLATAEGVASSIAFQAGNAEALPFPDEAFDVVFTCTVLEECDADRAIAEVYRVLKPGGRAAVITRSSDLPPYWELEVPPDLKTTLMLPGGGFSLVTEVGIVDASLYQRFAQVFADSTPCPFWAVMVPISPMQQQIAATRLAPGERETFEQAASRAMDTGNGFLGNPYHAIVGAK